MSIRAINWAMAQRTDGPSAQIVLLVIADSANEHGVTVYADPDYIAERTRQSRATVFRRLEELERAAVVTRFTKHLEDGRRQYEVRCRLDLQVNYRVRRDRSIALFAYDDDECSQPLDEVPYGDDPQDVEAESQIETETESQIETHGISPVRLTESHSCDSHIEVLLVPTKEDSPPYPPQGGDERTHDDRTRGRQATESLAPFIAAYPDQLIADYARTQAVWSAMTAQEQADAIVGAKGYAELIRKERLAGRNRSVKDAHSWLRNRQWTGYLGVGKTIEAAKLRFDAAEGSDEWNAWTVFYRCCGRRGIPESAVLTGGGQTRASVPSQWPPVGRGLDPDEREWLTFAEGTPQFAAWLRKLREIDSAIGLRTVTIDGKQVRALRVPCEWPPGKQAEAVAQGP